MPRQTARKAQNAVAETPVAVQAQPAVPEKKTRGRKPAQPVQPVVAAPVVPVPVAPAVPEKKTRGRKPAQPVVSQPVQETVQESEETSSETKKRLVPTPDTLREEFDGLSALIEAEIASIKESSSAASKSSAATPATTKVKPPTTKTLGVKFLRTVNKRLKILAAHTARVTKQRKNSARRNNANSGFRKPVQISDELARFTGWDPSQKYSRVDVTKYMCNYIKEKGLQRPDDKREIQVQNDPALQQLLKYDNSDEPLRYYSLQTYLAPHFQTASSTVDSVSA